MGANPACEWLQARLAEARELYRDLDLPSVELSSIAQGEVRRAVEQLGSALDSLDTARSHERGDTILDFAAGWEWKTMKIPARLVEQGDGLEGGTVASVEEVWSAPSLHANGQRVAVNIVTDRKSLLVGRDTELVIRRRVPLAHAEQPG
jgi:hypothetical protein